MIAHDLPLSENVPNWLKIIRDTTPDMPLILVGTKIDLENACTETETYQAFVDENNLAGLVLTSSKTGDGIDDAFNRLIKIFELAHDLE